MWTTCTLLRVNVVVLSKPWVLWSRSVVITVNYERKSGHFEAVPFLKHSIINHIHNSSVSEWKHTFFEFHFRVERREVNVTTSQRQQRMPADGDRKHFCCPLVVEKVYSHIFFNSMDGPVKI